MRKLFLLAAILLFLLPLAPLPAAPGDGYLVIVHPTNAVDSIERDLLSSFLLKKKSRWESGTGVDPADLEGQSPVRAKLSEDIHGRSVASIKNYWQRQIFSGRNVPPPEVATDAEMIAFVRERPGAIGYVSPSTAVSGVKTVRIVD